MENPRTTNDTMKSTNTLLLNDDSTSSRMTQLDIEHTGGDHTRNNSDKNDAYSDNYDEDEDDTELNDLPPLSTYIGVWKFWFQFAIWPLVFFVLNGVVVSTLIASNEYEFQYGNRHVRAYRSYEVFDSDRTSLARYEMLKYNRIIIAVLLFIDAFIIYRAVVFLDNKVRELDMIGDVNPDDDVNQFTAPSTNTGLKPNVHAQVSRKLDKILGRHPQSRISILVSILWLFFAGCGTVGIVSVADFLFAVSPKGKHVCTGQSTSTPSHAYERSNNGDDDNTNNDFDGSNRGGTYEAKHIDNIPDELQEWARMRHGYSSQVSNLVHLTNGVTYVTAANPLENKTLNFWTGSATTQLVSIGVDGNITFYKDAVDPSDFTSISGDDPLSSTGFCCLYRRYSSQSNAFDPFMDYVGPEVALLCNPSSDTITDGVFPNVTLFQPSHKNGVQESLDSVSIRSYNQKIWIKATFSIYNENDGGFKSLAKIYNASISQNIIELNKITDLSMSGDGIDENPFFLGPGSPCYRWTSSIDATVFAVVLVSTSAWLTKIKNLSVGIVPAVIAVSMTLSRINRDLGLAISSLSAVAAFFGLLGCINVPLTREKLIWAMYTLLFCVAGLIFSGRFYYYYDSFYNFNRALVTITVASIIGFILNHPVLYLFGWVGGIWAIFCGIFLLFTPAHGGISYHTGIFSIGLGIIMGSGCATIGFNLNKYRAHVVYYSRRAWFAMNAAIHSSNNNRAGRRNTTSSSTTTRYTPVTHAPHVSSVETVVPGLKENDITAGLLNRNDEGRSH